MLDYDLCPIGPSNDPAVGFNPVAKLVRGQPAQQIGNFAREIGADLIVVGHRRQNAFKRWW